ncbi:MAG: hypothetical protein PSX80_09445, partial [bacterium]|nr:hypothetical protein [bacterium]
HEANKPGEETMALMKSIRETRKAGGTISEDQKAQMKAFRDSRKQNMEAVHQQVLGILTAEQRAQLEAKKAEMKTRKEQRRQLRQQKKAEAKPPDIS